MHKKSVIKILCLILVISGFIIDELSLDLTKKAQAYGFDPGYVIDDNKFVDRDSMSINDIQYFLNEQNSELKDYSEGGRSAAHIIWDAAQGWLQEGDGKPKGNWGGIIDINEHSGTVNPRVILVTLQKEQSLITNNYAYGDKQRAYDCAMSYGALEGGGCKWMFENRPQYKGFTNQVEWAAAQLRWNYERAYGHGYTDYQAGGTYTFDDQVVHLGNRATASLYRYTPHIQYNFWRLYDQYFENPVRPPKELDAVLYYKSNDPTKSLKPGEIYSAEVKYYNKGTTNWYPNEFYLGTSEPQDRISIFNEGAGWTNSGSDKNRIAMSEGHADHGDVATFRFELKAPSERPTHTTTYQECLKPVKDKGNPSGWFDDESKVCFNIPVEGIDQTYRYQYVSQSPTSPDYVTLLPGQSTTFELKVKNTGESTWSNQVVRLGTDRPVDRVPFYTRGNGWRYAGDGNRVEMQEESVASGENATFRFNLTLPENISGGTYREYFRLVADHITWMQDYGIYWDIKVPSAQERYSCEWITQNRADFSGSEPITLYRGQKYGFSVTFKNNGLETWTRDKVKLGTSRNKDRVSSFVGYTSEYGWISSNRIQMEQESVVPGQYATFSFDLKVPDNIVSGEYREYFQPVAEFITWMQDYGVYWRIKIP